MSNYKILPVNGMVLILENGNLKGSFMAKWNCRDLSYTYYLYHFRDDSLVMDYSFSGNGENGLSDGELLNIWENEVLNKI